MSVVAANVPRVELRDAFAMAEDLLEHHGLQGWTVAYDGAKRRAGICRFGPKVLGLSAPLTALHSEAEVRDTILHEIAHAIAGPRHGHDATWRAIAEYGDSINPLTAHYLNRLSDLLFILARCANVDGAGDVLWQPGASR